MNKLLPTCTYIEINGMPSFISIIYSETFISGEPTMGPETQVARKAACQIISVRQQNKWLSYPIIAVFLLLLYLIYTSRVI